MNLFRTLLGRRNENGISMTKLGADIAALAVAIMPFAPDNVDDILKVVATIAGALAANGLRNRLDRK